MTQFFQQRQRRRRRLAELDDFFDDEEDTLTQQQIEQVDANSAAILSIQEWITTATQSLSIATAANVSQQEQIGGILTTISSIWTELNDPSTGLEVRTERVESLIATLRTQIQTLESTKADTSRLNTIVADLNSQLRTVNGNFVTLAGTVADLEPRGTELVYVNTTAGIGFRFTGGRMGFTHSNGRIATSTNLYLTGDWIGAQNSVPTLANIEAEFRDNWEFWKGELYKAFMGVFTNFNTRDQNIDELQRFFDSERMSFNQSVSPYWVVTSDGSGQDRILSVKIGASSVGARLPFELHF